MLGFFALFLLVLPFVSHAQLVEAGPLSSDVELLREHIFSGIPKDMKENERKRNCYHFTDLSAHFISDLINSENVYRDWPELESYMNRVMEEVLPPPTQPELTRVFRKFARQKAIPDETPPL